MAKQDNLFMTPVVEVRWFKLDKAVDEYTPKPGRKEFTCDLILDESVPEEKEFLERIEQHFLDEFGRNAKRNTTAIKISPDKEKPGKMVVQFKIFSWQSKTNPNEWSPGPTIMDAAKNPWPFGREIGNGSKCRIQYSVFPWNNNGAGIWLQPHVVQVVEWLERDDTPQGDVSAFEPVPGGYVADQAEETVNCPLPGA